MVREKSSFSESKRICDSNSGRLFAPTTQREMDTIRQLADALGLHWSSDPYWIGYSLKDTFSRAYPMKMEDIDGNIAPAWTLALSYASSWTSG